MWYFFEDPAYLNELDKFQNPAVLFSPKELNPDLLKDILKNNKDILATFLPPDNIKSLFVVKELPNKYPPFTSAEYEYLKSLPEKEREREKEKLLQEKLGLRIFSPTLNLSKLGGMQNLKKYVSLIKALEKVSDKRLKIRGIFLVGLAGTGKSFSAKVVSGELNRHLVELNLSKIMETPNPIFTLHKVFQYLEKLSLESRMKFILWIDEIEKMFASLEGIEKKVLGQLLTILNDLNTEEGYRVDAIFWATANDIQSILDRNPEFLRSGRFDKLFFVDTPCYPDEAIEIFKIYFREFNLPEITNWKELVDLAQKKVWQKLAMDYSSPEARVYIYTPAEIKQVVLEVKRNIIFFLNAYGKLENFQDNPHEIETFLREFYNDLSPHFDFETLLVKIGKEAENYKRMLEFLRDKKGEYTFSGEWEAMLFALFYNEMYQVSPLLKTARETVQKMRDMATEFFVKVSKC